MRATLMTEVGLLVDGCVIKRLESEGTPAAKGRSVFRTPSLPRYSTVTAAPEASLDAEDSKPIEAGNQRSLLTLEEEPMGLSLAELQSLPYTCEPTDPQVPQRRFEFMDVLPWGFRSPTTVFSTLGLHTNKGIVAGTGPAGFIRIRPYSLFRSRSERAKHGNEPFSLCQCEQPPPTLSGSSNLKSAESVSSRRSGLNVPPRRPLTAAGKLAPESIRDISEKSCTLEAIERRNAFFKIALLLREAESKTHQGLDLTSPVALNAAGVSTPASHPSPYGSPVSQGAEDGFLGAGVPERGGAGGGLLRGNAVAAEVNPLSLLFVSEEDMTEECLASQSKLLDEWSSELELWDVADLQLAPALALHPPIPPCRVGSRVVARRFGGGLELATVTSVQYDASYSLLYDSDGGLDTGVLHNDIHLLDDSDAEPCTVRDRVVATFEMQMPAIIVEAAGGGRYRVMLLRSPSGDAVPIHLTNIALISPLLKDGLYSDPQHVRWFKELDPNCTGAVTWRHTYELIKNVIELRGLPLPERKLRQIQSTISSKGHAAVRLHFFHMEDSMPLTFVEFEYALLCAQNMMN